MKTVEHTSKPQDSLDTLLAADRIAVPPELKSQVMAALPVASWEQRRYPAWALPLAAMLVMACGAAWIFRAVPAPASTGHMFGTGLAVLDFLRVTALAGAGLLAASWQGLGLALEELFAKSAISVLGLAGVVFFADLLLFSLLRRRPARVEAAVKDDSGAD